MIRTVYGKLYNLTSTLVIVILDQKAEILTNEFIN